MLRVAIGSTNPVKIKAVRSAFEKMGLNAEVTGVEVDSKVSEQPFSDEETIEGAINRARGALKIGEESPYDYGIGLEGGVVQTQYGMFVCNWGAIVNNREVIGIGGGHRVLLPSTLVEGLNKGEELGDIIDAWAGGKDIKKNEGTIGILTGNHITREEMFHDVVIAAFSRFLFPEYYSE
ncbi:inosine/xanthosine triphosphatase [Ammoniphilus sp. 3BR4]|uniref:inosine/xanthosine triphosphatase n=1 Tax=Ammoniphilus sp. 3BR4 TaxID=3158265 RepID=UPI003465AF53